MGFPGWSLGGWRGAEGLGWGPSKDPSRPACCLCFCLLLEGNATAGLSSGGLLCRLMSSAGSGSRGHIATVQSCPFQMLSSKEKLQMMGFSPHPPNPSPKTAPLHGPGNIKLGVESQGRKGYLILTSLPTSQPACLNGTRKLAISKTAHSVLASDCSLMPRWH